MREPLVLTHPPLQGEARLGRDRRYTPAWCTEVLLEHRPPPRLAGGVLDPAAGDGAILRVLRDHGHSPLYWLDVEPGDGVEEFEGYLDDAGIGNWLEVARDSALSRCAVVTNPPYSIGPEFMSATLETCPPYCAALLRLNHLGSATWAKFWREFPLTGMLVLGGRRPSFSADGKTDASEYFWAVWDDSPHQWIEIV